MNRIQYWLISALSMLLIQNAFGQKNDYIATDSSLTSGLKLVQGTSRDNAQFIRLKRKSEQVKYYPDQLSEYGFKNGAVYVSKSIPVSEQTKQVFLERLEYGKINLYYYTEKGIRTYFLERDSTVFVELKKDNDFRKTISEFTDDFNWKASQVRLSKYNKKSLSKLISFYNSGRNKPLPFPRFGIIVGYNSTSIIIPSSISVVELNGISFSPSATVSLGLFGDLPIAMSDFSFIIAVNYLKSGFSVNSRSAQSDVDVVINYTSLNMPFLLRYTVPTIDWRPFVNTGAIYSYQFRNENNIYESSINQNVITINELQKHSLISESMLGYSFGLGLQKNLTYKKIAAVEFRFNQLFGNGNTLNKSHFEILTSFSF